MKILLIGEYSNVHNTLCEGLKALGNNVTVASNGDFWKNYPRDIDLSRKSSKWGGLKLLLRFYSSLNMYKGYDIVQIIGPMFMELKAERLIPIYHFLERHNRKIFLGINGNDYYCINSYIKDKPLKYSDFNIGNTLRKNDYADNEQKEYLPGTAKQRLNKYISENCDGIVAGLYEYWVCYNKAFPKKTTYIPYPIKSVELNNNINYSNIIKIFIGINKKRNAYKGTDIMLAAAEDITRKYPNRVELVKAVSVPFAEYQHLMDGSDLILDQLYSYTPSMNSLLAMSKGIVVVGGGEEEQYEFIGEKELRPIINVQPSKESVYHELEQIVLHPERIPELKRQSIEYVHKYHDYIKVAKQYEAFYKSLLNE